MICSPRKSVSVVCGYSQRSSREAETSTTTPLATVLSFSATVVQWIEQRPCKPVIRVATVDPSSILGSGTKRCNAACNPQPEDCRLFCMHEWVVFERTAHHYSKFSTVMQRSCTPFCALSDEKTMQRRWTTVYPSAHILCTMSALDCNIVATLFLAFTTSTFSPCT